MKLLNVYTFQLEDKGKIQQTRISQGKSPYVSYAILSHVWLARGDDGPSEVVMSDLLDWKSCTMRKPLGAAKILGACKAVSAWSMQRRVWQPEEPEITHIWIDSCCIDQTNPAELSMSINSMYRWYQEATVCLVYLYDIYRPERGPVELSQSRWFTRGWTLQELIAPYIVEFYDAKWQPMGTKASLRDSLSTITNIDTAVLTQPGDVHHVSVAQRMSWAAKRVTTVEEDGAYSLLGLFGVQMAPLYGEGQRSAYRRLQEEILKYSDDHSIFAWQDNSGESTAQGGLLAPHPTCFDRTGTYLHLQDAENLKPFAMSNKGLSIDLHMIHHPAKDGRFIASLDCPIDRDHFLGIFLRCINESTRQYTRCDVNKLCQVKADGRGPLRSIFVRQPL